MALWNNVTQFPISNMEWYPQCIYEKVIKYDFRCQEEHVGIWGKTEYHLVNGLPFIQRFSSTQSILQYLSHSPAHWWWRQPCKVPSAHIRSKLFSILLKNTSTCSSAQPGGAGIQTSNLPITRLPALPAELQPPNTYTYSTQSTYIYHTHKINKHKIHVKV